MKMQNPHDKFFKDTFGNVAIAKDFLQHYLPESLRQVMDMDSLEPQKESFVNEALEENFSDLLFQADIQDNKGFVYFLFEHKSYPDRSIILQLLTYMLEIWKTKTRQENEWHLPIVVPLVIYHGKGNWNEPERLSDMIRGYHTIPNDSQAYIPDFKYLLWDLTDYSDEELRGGAQLRAFLTICRDILTTNTDVFLKSIERAVYYLSGIEGRETRLTYLDILMRYIFNASRNLTENEIGQVAQQIETIDPEGSDFIMTLAERYMEKGKEKGKEEIAKKLIQKGLPTEEIMNLTEFDKKEIEQIKEKMAH